jgi:hypothetical protein
LFTPFLGKRAAKFKVRVSETRNTLQLHKYLMSELKLKNIIFLAVMTIQYPHLAHHNLPKTAIP